MKIPPTMFRSFRVACAVGFAITLSGCVNVRYDDEHADRSTRLYRMAIRFDQTMRTRGMAGVSSDIDDCYRESTVPLIKRFALQDCISYDYAAFVFDREAAKKLFHGIQTPPFEPAVAGARLEKFGKLDGFADRTETVVYAIPTATTILNDIQAMPGSFLNPNGTRRPPLMHGGGTF